MREEQRTFPRPEKVTIGLPQDLGKMVYLGADQELVCRRCGTKVEDGRACGKNLTAVFWYCPTCDEFLEWHAYGITKETTAQCQASVGSFLRWLRHHAE